MNRTEMMDANGVWDRIVGTYSIGQNVIRPVGKVVPSLGVFVGLEPGFDALIHVSKIAGLGGQDPRRFYATGQTVSAKVVNIDSRTHRIELATDLCEFSFDRFLSKDDQVVASNINLADIEVTSAVLYGAWIQDRPEARPELVSRTETELSIQLQAKCAHWDRQALKCVKVTLKQVGNDVAAHADWAAVTSSNHDYGYDLTEISKRELSETQDEGGVNVAISGDDLESAEAVGYGCAKLCFRKRPSMMVQTQAEVNHCMTKSETKPILVDGSNIVRRWPNLRSEALAGLLEGLKANGYVPTVFFDANIRHVLQDNGDVFGQNLLDCLTHEDPDHTIVVPSGMRSDDYMLLLADRRGYQIISCDTYRDESFAKYSWLRNRVESGDKRVHAPAFVLGDLVIPTLGIVWPFAQTSIVNFPVNGDVFIQAFNGEFLCAEDEKREQVRRILANRDNPSDWERFVLFRNSDGSVSIKAKANGKYLSVEDDSCGRLLAQSDEVREQEKFWLARRVNDGRYVLRSYANMKYASVDHRSGEVAVRAQVVDERELLTIMPCG